MFLHVVIPLSSLFQSVIVVVIDTIVLHVMWVLMHSCGTSETGGLIERIFAVSDKWSIMKIPLVVIVLSNIIVNSIRNNWKIADVYSK